MDVSAIIKQEKVRYELLIQIDEILKDHVFSLNEVERGFLTRIKHQVSNIDISVIDFNNAANDYIAFIEAKQETE